MKKTFYTEKILFVFTSQNKKDEKEAIREEIDIFRRSVREQRKAIERNGDTIREMEKDLYKSMAQLNKQLAIMGIGKKRKDEKKKVFPSVISRLLLNQLRKLHKRQNETTKE
ncbi:hypothetical protein SNEBB_008799 [Seison nebaliae]|nr:hypothetical protein SNEBB_008799 [Seison nebaliae]